MGVTGLEPRFRKTIPCDIDGTPYSSTNPMPVDTSTTGGVFDSVEKKTSSVGTSSTTVTFSQDVTVFSVQNQHATNSLYVKVSGGTATTSDFLLGPGEWHTWEFKVVAATGVSLIASGSGTTTLLLGYYNA